MKRVNNYVLSSSKFTLTHMYLALAIAESILNEEGYGLPTPDANTLDELSTEEIERLFNDYVRELKLGVLCHA